MAKNLPARERAARRSRSNYSNPQRAGGPKVSYDYPAWVTQRRLPPKDIILSLHAASGARHILVPASE